MAFVINKVGNTNGIPYNEGNEYFFELKERLKAQGWTVPRSGDASTYNSSGDQITSSGSGAGGMRNNRAWFEIRSPDGQHNFIFQVPFPGYSWRNKYSENAFTGGTPSANTCGSAVNEVVILGSGTDASPSGASAFRFSASSRLMNVSVEDQAPYRFWANGHVVGTLAPDAITCVDQFIADSYDASDPFPFVVGHNYLPTSAKGFTNYGEMYSQYGGTWNEVALIAPAGWGRINELVAAGGVDPISGDDIPFPAIWGRHPLDSAPTGWRGVSSLFEVSLVNRSNADTATRSSTRDRIYVADGTLTAAWNGEVPA